MNETVNELSAYFKKKFPFSINKIAIDAGFTCPNRDGSQGYGGCTYCNNQSFSPFYVEPQRSIRDQIQKGIDFHSVKGGERKYIAYFQSYTNTYSPIEQLSKLYREALEPSEIIGLTIGTRPDCVNEEILGLLQELSQSHYVSVEYGVESTLDKTLDLIKRGHSFEDAIKSIKNTADRGIPVGAHLILGLPGETEEEMIGHAKKISELPIQFLKIHHLQIIQKTQMAHDFKLNPDNYSLFSIDHYIEFLAIFIAHLRADIVVERVCSSSSNDLLIAPKWGKIRNAEVMNLLKKHMRDKDLWQGKHVDLVV